uniref:Integrase catalytic domain-containing protein n=1 Tax=Strigamia maritima TaxID=126957 RepID=T1ITM6_STRMM
MNGVAERFNRSAIEALRTTIVDDNMDRMWWAEVLMAYIHVKNRLSQKLLEGQTPYERVFNRKPNTHYFRVIGSKCYRLLPKTQRDSKLGPVSKECILIGYSWNTKGYRIYDPEEDKVYNTQDVRFIESLYADATKHSVSFGPDDNGNRGKSVNPSPNPKVTLPIPTSSIPKVVVKDEGQSRSLGNWDRVVKQRPTTGQHPNRYDATLSYQPQKFHSAKSVMKYCEDKKIDYSREGVKDSFKYNNSYMSPWDIRNVSDGGTTDSPDADSPDESHVSSTSVSNLVDLAVYFEGLECSNMNLANPFTYSEALASPNKSDWETAMGDKVETLRERNVFKEVERTPQMKKVAESFKVGFDLAELNLEGDVLDASQYPYRTMVGILYTRPDISIAIGILARYNTKLKLVHWNCIMHLWNYVVSTKDKCIHLSGNSNLKRCLDEIRNVRNLDFGKIVVNCDKQAGMHFIRNDVENSKTKLNKVLFTGAFACDDTTTLTN